VGVTFAFTELPYAHAVVRYACECGVVELRHGRRVEAPPGWVGIGAGEKEDREEYRCPRCAAAEAPAAPPGGRAE
jgi:hypothetical protein